MLSDVRVQVLVLHAARNRVCDVAHAYRIAQLVPGAQLVVLDSADHLLWLGDADTVLGEIERLADRAVPCTVPKLSWGPCDLVFGAAQAIRWYSLITPLRTCRRWIGASSGMMVAVSWLVGRCLRLWCGRWLLKCRVYSSRTAAAWRSL